MTHGWKGKHVKHADGRTGTIRTEVRGFLHLGLKIEIDGGDKTDWVQLNANGQDTGSKGWSWDAAHPGEPENWMPLGDHNKAAA